LALGIAETGRTDPPWVPGADDVGRAGPLMGAALMGAALMGAALMGAALMGAALMGAALTGSGSGSGCWAGSADQSAPGAGAGGSSYASSAASGVLVPAGVRVAFGSSPALSAVACRLSIWLLSNAGIPRRRWSPVEGCGPLPCHIRARQRTRRPVAAVLGCFPS
jgi:hypothetical protein